MPAMFGYYGPDPTYRPQRKDEQKGLVPFPVASQQASQPAMFNVAPTFAQPQGGSGASIPQIQTTAAPQAGATFNPLQALQYVNSAKNLPSNINGLGNLFSAAAGGHLNSAFATSPGAALRAGELGFQYGTPGNVPANIDLAGSDIADLIGGGASSALPALSAVPGGAGFGSAAGGAASQLGVAAVPGGVTNAAVGGAGQGGGMLGGFAANPMAWTFAIPAAAAAAYGMLRGRSENSGPNFTVFNKPDGSVGIEADNLSNFNYSALPEYFQSIGGVPGGRFTFHPKAGVDQSPAGFIKGYAPFLADYINRNPMLDSGGEGGMGTRDYGQEQGAFADIGIMNPQLYGWRGHLAGVP